MLTKLLETLDIKYCFHVFNMDYCIAIPNTWHMFPNFTSLILKIKFYQSVKMKLPYLEYAMSDFKKLYI